MRNAGASIDPPTDPFAAVPPPAPPKKHPVRPGSASLPRGVSADIFGDRSPQPAPAAARIPRQSSLPPPPRPVEPWPMAETTVKDEPAVAFDPEPEPKSRTGRYALIGLSVLLLALYLVPAVSMAGRVLSGTTVLGVDIGGQTRAEATLTLRERLYGQIRAPIIVRQGARRLTVNPEDAGLQLDVEATVRQASSGFPSPGDVWASLTGGREVKPVISVDREKLAAAVSKDVAAFLENPAQEGGVAFKGLTPVPIYPKAGHRIDRAAVALDIEEAYLSPDVMVVAAMVKDAPQVTRSAVHRALALAKDAVAGPITLTNGTRSAQIPPAVIAESLTFAPDDHALRPHFDAAKAVAGLERQLVDPEQAARDAGFAIVRGRPSLVHGRPGKRVDTGRLASDVLAAVEGPSRTVPVTLTDGQPAVTDEDALKLGITEEAGRFTTSYDCCLPRVANIQAAARSLNNHLVKPGETFSFNEVVGRRDAAAGFPGGVTATMIRGRAGSDVAGMSQVATTMLNAVMRAGLADVEHTAPEVYAPQYPAGMDAAVSYPAPDLRWKNDSPYGVLIQASATDTSLTVVLWSTKRYDVELRDPVKTRVTHLPPTNGGGKGCVPVPEEPGFTAEVTRVLQGDGKVVDRQTFTTVYQPQAAVVCSAK
ncbi:VanW family protein [Planotetraspora sp. A-T 1434]|uniref:VanW family protein n=1 Tax=Planotetraspora sp. A-T 1434 TaxID=2979219 RepID=UPI0021C1BC83|nr:VanW family protein [Planotetraspora sp. A-T 1434]MCT9931379.1 VanW family protein [Planotetraspora sp. A-T 1434]